MPDSKLQVEIKKVSCDASQGSKQFLAGIASIGKLRHSNLVTLFGYCVHEGQLLLVYEFMSNLSLDKFLYPKRGSLSSSNLGWSKDFTLSRVQPASRLGEVVIHHDIKSRRSYAGIGDFGLLKLYDHGAGSGPTSIVVGTPGYIAPEMPKIGISLTETKLGSRTWSEIG